MSMGVSYPSKSPPGGHSEETSCRHGIVGYEISRVSPYEDHATLTLKFDKTLHLVKLLLEEISQGSRSTPGVSKARV
jgi:hypothetical protein